MFSEGFEPTFDDSYRTRVDVDGRPCILEIMDTAGREENSPLRDQYIRDGEAFILVYSVTSRSSFLRIRDLYLQIMRVKIGTR